MANKKLISAVDKLASKKRPKFRSTWTPCNGTYVDPWFGKVYRCTEGQGHGGKHRGNGLEW